MSDDWRVSAMFDRLIANIPAACKVLEEAGYGSLAGQLRRDHDALVFWWRKIGEDEDDD